MKQNIKELLFPFYKIIRSTLFFPIEFYQYYKGQELNKVKKKFADSLSFFKTTIFPEKTNGIVLVQMVKDYEFTIKLAAASKVFSEKHNLLVNIYDVNWMPWKGWSNAHKLLCDYFFQSGLKKMYLQFGNKIVLSCEDKYPDQRFIKEKLEKIKKELLNPEDILSLKFDNIHVGDLIYDHYLRHFHQPTIEKFNNDVFFSIEVALNVFYNFKDYLKNNDLKILLNTYTSYIHHGIPARICLDRNIEVYTIGSYSYILQKLSKDFPYHQINHTLFDPEMNLSAGQLQFAKEKLTSRFEGKIDEATSYMRTSAYSDKPINIDLKKRFEEQSRNIIIYVHDFYDSPHVNRMLQFPDLYQFLKQTLSAIKEIKGANVFIKTHPNGIEGCKEKTIELVNSFNNPYFHILDESVSNLNIIELRPDLIVTARGTVCLEMAYFDIPTVALFDNLYASFDFTHTCLDKPTFFSIIMGDQKAKNVFNKEKIFKFYYQAFLEKTIHEKNDIYNQLASFKGDTYNDRYLEFILAHEKEIFCNNFLEYYSKLN